MGKKKNKQNVTRDNEIKNKLSITRGVGGDGQWGKTGKGHQGTCIKDPWTKPKGVGLRVGGRDGWGREEVDGGKWRQLYFNNNKKLF